MTRVLLLSLVFLLESCALRLVVLSNLDWFITQQVDRQLNLYGEQEDILQNDIKTFIKQNKSIIASLDEKLASLPLKKPKVEQSALQALKIYNEVVELGAPIIAKTLASLDDKQIAKFEKNNLEQNFKIQKRIEDFEIKSIYKRYERFLGELNQEQKNLIIENKSLYVDLLKQRLERRLQLQSELLSILKLSEGKQQLLIKHLKSSALSDFNSTQKKNFKVIERILELATKEQMAQIKKKQKEARAWTQDFLLSQK